MWTCDPVFYVKTLGQHPRKDSQNGIFGCVPRWGGPWVKKNTLCVRLLWIHVRIRCVRACVKRILARKKFWHVKKFWRVSRVGRIYIRHSACNVYYSTPECIFLFFLFSIFIIFWCIFRRSCTNPSECVLPIYISFLLLVLKYIYKSVCVTFIWNYYFIIFFVLCLIAEGVIDVR